jgi:pimeloyl-ACP methyl ester carboxylesterase
MQEPQSRNIDVRGLNIHYLEWSARQGTPLILIHGFLDHARSWEPFVASLVGQSRNPIWIVAPDCRGHGDSGWVGAGGYYHFPDYLLDLDSLLSALKVSAATLMGHSMGGTISFLYAGAFPQRVKKLILVEGIGPIGMNFSDAPGRMEKWISDVREVGRRVIREYSTLEEARKRLQRTNPRLSSDLALRLARWGMKQRGNGKWIWKFDPLHRTSAPQPFYLEQALEYFRRIVCPVLIVRGNESRQASRPDMQKRLDVIAVKTLVSIEGAGHMIHHDNPEELASVVAKFLSQ